MPAPAPGTARGDTVPRMFWDAVVTRGDQVAMRQKDLGIWKPVSWRELGVIVGEVSAGLIALGYASGEVASVLSNTNREWVYADLGALCAAGVVNGIYPTDASSQVEYLCADSRTTVIFVEDEEQLDKVLEVRARLPQLRHVIVFDMEGLRDLADPQVLSLEALRALGRDHLAKNPTLLAARAEVRGADDLAILVYTSGTTGRPKGAMISHKNIIVTCHAYNSFLPQGPADERMAFLPLCHIAERIGGEYFPLLTGSVINFVENPDTVPENVREIQPTTFTAVPRVWEKFYSAVLIRIREATRLQQWAYAWAIGVGMRRAKLQEQWQPVPTGLEWQFKLARFMVLDNIRRMIGVHRARFLVTGAAPISPDLVRWYMALGLDMIEVWGMTESCGAVTSNPLGRVRPGSIGPATAHAEVKISTEGELLVKGASVFMGYLNLPEKTAETIRDGWLHTGDVGRVDADGYFYITDRMKDIIITAGGKNITPSEFENQLKFSPYITDAVVIGDKRAYLSCLVMIDHENVEQWAQERSIPFSDYKSLTRRPEVIGLIGEEIEKVNKLFARVEQIKQFRLIENKLTPEDEELTPTMKLKRKLVGEKYRDLIDSMYSKTA
ncbi:MAG: long-chain fatty acid--CoA ligase [Burkholderiales bacterium]|nr:long-chain fatty acid--CoA ligase [Burkholderiales bacterium]